MIIEPPLYIKGMQQCVILLIIELGQYLSDSYIVAMAYQYMATKYNQPLPASSSLGQTKGFSTQGLKGYMSIKHMMQNPQYLSSITYQQKSIILATR
jgi:hypothetical protein